MYQYHVGMDTQWPGTCFSCWKNLKKNTKEDGVLKLLQWEGLFKISYLVPNCGIGCQGISSEGRCAFWPRVCCVGGRHHHYHHHHHHHHHHHYPDTQWMVQKPTWNCGFLLVNDGKCGEIYHTWMQWDYYHRQCFLLLRRRFTLDGLSTNP